jgi:predicted HD phosphohydrolase
MKTVSFTKMGDGTADDFLLLHESGKPYVAGLPDRILAVLDSMRDAFPGYQITSLDHLLQTATRAERDGAEEEMIVAALLHDIGDVFAPHNHAEFGAAIIRPYVSERTHWIIEHHATFQLYHYGQHVGCDPLARERFRSSPYYEDAIAFCARWDQTSFDPEYQTYRLEHFEPMLKRVLSRKPRSLILPAGDS